MSHHTAQRPALHESRTATVPIYLSTAHSRSRSKSSSRSHHSSRSGRSHRSNQSRSHRQPRPLFNEHVDGGPRLPIRTNSPAEQSDMYGSYRGTSSSRSHSSSNSHSHSRIKRRKVSRSTILRRHMASKLRLAISSGLTTLVAGIVIIALFAAHVMRGTLSIVLFSILVVSLLAIFIHSLIRYYMLKDALRSHTEKIDLQKKTPSYRGWNISRPLPAAAATADGWYGQTQMEPPTEGMRVFMNEDLEAGIEADEADDNEHEHADGRAGGHEAASLGPQRPNLAEEPLHPGANIGLVRPPPVYGNFRNSIRLDPTALHSIPVPPPSVHTPTYEQATAPTLPNTQYRPPGLGYRPPSYGSSGGITQVLANRRHQVEEKLHERGIAVVGQDAKGRAKGGWVRKKGEGFF